MATTNLTIRMDETIKAQFDDLCAEIGLSASAAINIFARQMIREQGFPFAVSAVQPNAETLAAMQETREIAAGRIPAVRYSSVKEAFAALDAEIAQEEDD